MPENELQSRTLLCGRARRHHYAGAMPLGVRSFRGGVAHYKTATGSYAVDDGCWLVLNDGQSYELSIDSPAEVESTVVFFPTGWASVVARIFRERPELLLDEPLGTGESVTFLEATVPHDQSVTSQLLALDRAGRHQKIQEAYLEEALRDLLAALLMSQRDHRERANRLPSAKASTRQELYRRLCRGRDYLGASALSAPTLADAASAANLSPYHFQRSFKLAFGQTPHEYATARRLSHARRLLTDIGTPPAQVAVAIGYSSYSAFHLAYSRHFGEAPGRVT